MEVIKVENLTKCYGNFKAVDSISFSIKNSEIVGFVGKNGAGKSTTLRCIMNFISPTSGSYSVNGEKGVKVKNQIAYMAADASFYPNLTSRETLKFCSEDSEIIGELAEYFELDLDKKISELSLGNRKKVSIIQMFINKCKIFIMDEPTSGLDPLMQERFFKLLLKKKEEGCTIFLSSHNLFEIEKYCNRAIIIKDGKIIDEIDMKTRSVKLSQIVNYKTLNGEEKSFEFSGDINELIKELSTLKLENVEIKNKSVEDEFIKYYEEETHE